MTKPTNNLRVRVEDLDDQTRYYGDCELCGETPSVMSSAVIERELPDALDPEGNWVDLNTYYGHRACCEKSANKFAHELRQLLDAGGEPSLEDIKRIGMRQVGSGRHA